MYFLKLKYHLTLKEIRRVGEEQSCLWQTFNEKHLIKR